MWIISCTWHYQENGGKLNLCFQHIVFFSKALVLHLIEYDNRSLVYRASLSECYVPYGDASPTHRFKDIFDGGECGLGTYTNSLVYGCDCLGEIYYFDAVIHNERGSPLDLPHAVCLHEEDAGVLWHHTANGSCRSRRLVLQTITTLGNYE
jgi:primary-amine oxidase